MPGAKDAPTLTEGKTKSGGMSKIILPNSRTHPSHAPLFFEAEFWLYKSSGD
jgi:hypothetical protein